MDLLRAYVLLKLIIDSQKDTPTIAVLSQKMRAISVINKSFNNILIRDAAHFHNYGLKSLHACIRNLNTQILLFSKITFQRRSKFEYCISFPLFYFTEKKSLDSICVLESGNLSSDSFFINLVEWSFDSVKWIRYLSMINYLKIIFKSYS